MSKKNVVDTIKWNWVSELNGLSAEDASTKLKAHVPSDFSLKLENDYDYSYGVLVRVREETDAEYSARVQLEKVTEDEREQERIREALYLQNKIALLKSQDIALSAYLEKHKDNPKIGDMENLFTALAQVQMSGKADGQVVEQLKECLAKLERLDGTL